MSDTLAGNLTGSLESLPDAPNELPGRLSIIRDNNEIDIDYETTGQRADLEVNVKSTWQNCENSTEFAELAGRTQAFAEKVDMLINLRGTRGETFQRSVEELATWYLDCVKAMLPHDSSREIHWSSSSDNIDNIISVLPELIDVRATPDKNDLQDYCKILRRHFPKPVVEGLDNQRVALTFFRSPAPSSRPIAKSIYDTLVELYSEYTPAVHLAPYTSLVGPSGVGKSYTVQRIAAENYAYVVYASLAGPSSGAYPTRSPIANRISGINDREDLTVFFEFYIAASLVNVQLCRDNDITPNAFFRIQADEKFKLFNERIASLIAEYAVQARERLSKAGRESDYRRFRSDTKSQEEGGVILKKFEYRDHVNAFVEDYKNRAKKEFSSIKAETKDLHSDIESRVPHKTEPAALICFDEASGLFGKEGDPVKFLALRRAMRHRAMESRGKRRRAPIEETFFGLLLDTASRVSSFSPPNSLDPSERHLRGTKLLRPVFEIDTFDVFGPSIEPKEKIKLDKLFRLGRPLWGAYIEEFGVAAAEALAAVKARCGITDETYELRGEEALALLSYRINFYVIDHSIAEKLTSRYLRYIVHVSRDRTLVSTLQPSEPILAWTSAKQTAHSPQARLTMIKNFFQEVSEGTIAPGDIGEQVAALLLLFAFDRQTILSGETSPGPIHLRTFFAALLPGNINQEIASRSNENSCMRDVWSHGRVFFNHLVRVRDVTDDTLRGAYTRGAGLFTKQGFEGVDLIIPIYLPETDRFTFLLIQVKNKAKSSLGRGMREEAKRSFQSAEKHLPKWTNRENRPYIGLYMSLRGKDEAVGVAYPNLLEKHTRRGLRTAIGTLRRRTSMLLSNVSQEDPELVRFNWDDGDSIVIASSGMTLDMFPGVGFPRSATNESHNIEIVEYLKALLSCAADGLPSEKSPFLQHLTPLG